MLQYSVRVYTKQKTHFRQVMAIEGAFHFIYSSGVYSIFSLQGSAWMSSIVILTAAERFPQFQLTVYLNILYE